MAGVSPQFRRYVLMNKQTCGQAWALQVDCALEVQACLASNRNAIAGDLAPHASTAGTQLRPAQRLLTEARRPIGCEIDRKSTRLNSSHLVISYAVFCLKKKKKNHR